MANIKVSELPSASSFNDEDLVMIVQSNESKKISGEDLFKSNIKSGNWTPALSNSANDGEPAVNYRYQTGEYIKIDKLVIAFFRVSGYITAVNGSNYASIKGLPFNVSSSYSMGAFTSVYNLVNSSNMPTIGTLVSPQNQIGLFDGDNLGSSIINYKLSGTNYFECFGGIMYETSDN